MRLLAACALAALLLGGCKSYPLGDEWSPLVSVEEVSDRFFPEGTTSTIVPHCYTASLADWLLAYPPGSVEQHALLLHEQVHARRQIEQGVPYFLRDYATFASVRWEEERLGYHAEIVYLVQHGKQVDVAFWARAMATRYVGLDGPMIDEDIARAWLLSEVQAASR